MTAETPVVNDWSSTRLSLSDGPELFDNAGIRRLRRAVEDDFARRYLDANGTQAIAQLPVYGDLHGLLEQVGSQLEKGSRLVLDLRSPAHWRASGIEASAWQDDPRVASISVDELSGMARERGLSVIAVEPYGGLWDNALLFERLPHRFKWLRLLSWLAHDEEFFRLGCLIEQQVFGRLDCSATGRYLVALEKDNAVPADHWREQLARCKSVLADPNLEGLSDQLGRSAEAFAELGQPLLGSLRARHLVFILQQVLVKTHPGFDALSWLGGEVAAQLRQWMQARAIDARNMAIAKGWAGGAELRQRDGVDLVSGFEYTLAMALLHGYFQTHSGVSS